MIVSISQPAYLPWLGYFERIALSDLHIVLDHVQFEKSSFTNRNKIRTKEDAVWLTVPLATKGRFGDLAIHKLEFAPNSSWQKDHWATIQRSYARARYFKTYAPAYEELYRQTWPNFSAMVRAFLQQHLRDLGITTPLHFSSDLVVEGTKSDLILELCQQFKASTYISGALGRGYLDEAAFTTAGIEVRYQEYVHPGYAQTWPGFVSHLAVLDLLFNHGPASLDVVLRRAEVAA